GVSLRDAETYARAGNTGTQDLATVDLAVKNLLLVETPTIFQTGGSSVQNTLDLAGNSLVVNSTATTASLFTAFPTSAGASTSASAFDWTPPAGSAAASGGLTAFSGKLHTAAGAAVTPTSYVGAAQPGGAKWWSGWTIYAQN
ncbi:MAG: hypothetical protein ACJ79S_05745, partial [Gemmatimonadaceae bacterium]